jgi:hypothetical protein
LSDNVAYGYAFTGDKYNDIYEISEGYLQNFMMDENGAQKITINVDGAIKTNVFYASLNTSWDTGLTNPQVRSGRSDRSGSFTEYYGKTSSDGIKCRTIVIVKDITKPEIKNWIKDNCTKQ